MSEEELEDIVIKQENKILTLDILNQPNDDPDIKNPDKMHGHAVILTDIDEEGNAMLRKLEGTGSFVSDIETVLTDNTQTASFTWKIKPQNSDAEDALTVLVTGRREGDYLVVGITAQDGTAGGDGGEDNNTASYGETFLYQIISYEGDYEGDHNATTYTLSYQSMERE